MSNVISIEELRREFLEKSKPADVKEFVHKQQELLEKYIRMSQDLQKQLDHANDIIKTMGSPLLIGNSQDEEFICVEQIKILKERSQTRELDINDVKKLDLLIKNIRLIRSQPTENSSTTVRDVSETDLLLAARGD
jgi:esterase/lipase